MGKRKSKKSMKTKPDFNAGRESFIDRFIDDWSGAPKRVFTSALFTAVLMLAYFGFVTKPSTPSEWGGIALVVIISEVILISAAIFLKKRRNAKIALREKARDNKKTN